MITEIPSKYFITEIFSLCVIVSVTVLTKHWLTCCTNYSGSYSAGLCYRVWLASLINLAGWITKECFYFSSCGYGPTDHYQDDVLHIFLAAYQFVMARKEPMFSYASLLLKPTGKTFRKVLFPDSDTVCFHHSVEIPLSSLEFLKHEIWRKTHHSHFSILMMA